MKDFIERSEHDDYVVRANARVCELNREIERLTRDRDEWRSKWFSLAQEWTDDLAAKRGMAR